MKPQKNIAIILAAGSGKRCGVDKLFVSQNSMAQGNVLEKTVSTFEKCEAIDEILLVVPKEKMVKNNILKNLESKFHKIKKILPGGVERFFSLKKAIDFLRKNTASFSSDQRGNHNIFKNNPRLIIHNGANPNLEISDLERGLAKAEQNKNIIFGHISHNAIKKISGQKIIEHCDRKNYFEAQTPQISDLETLGKGIDWILKNETHKPEEKGDFQNYPKDEAEVLDFIGETVFIHQTTPENKKITFPEDYENFFKSGMNISNFRIGVGEDSHRFKTVFEKENPITFGGIKFPECQKTFEANSDGDVILHALSNALLSSIGEKTFDAIAAPICEAGIKDSQVYLKKTLEKIHEKHPNFKIQNCVISLEALVPKIEPKHETIVKNMAQILEIEPEKIGLTYTTGEGLSDYGKGLGVKGLVEVLIEIGDQKNTDGSKLEE